jgi:hypothetical protein
LSFTKNLLRNFLQLFFLARSNVETESAAKRVGKNCRVPTLKRHV